MPSSRVPVPAEFAPNRLAILLESKRGEGRALLDLTGTNPTRAGLAWPAPTLLSAITGDGVARHDPDPRGPASARDAVAAYLSSRAGDGAGALTVPPDRIFLTASTSEGYAHLFRLLCDPGDEVLIPRPCYPLIEPIARLECVRAIPYRLAYDERWRLDVDSLEASVGPRTRAVVLVQPNNPTGSCLDAREIGCVEALCVANGIAIISDEVFGDFPWAPDSRTLPSLFGATRAATFTLGGVSKSCGLPQMKVGWIVASGPRETVEPLLPGLEWILDLFLSVGAPAAAALPRFLEARGEFQSAMRARLDRNRRSLRDAAARSGGRLEPLQGDGGWTAIARIHVPSLDGAPPDPRADVAEWALARHDVHVHPGHFYDLAGDDLVVLSLVTDPSTFEEALARLAG